MAATASSGNPWKSNNDPKDFVGCKIEIISNSDIRYVGTLYTFDPHASTISLKDVQSYGTESRRSGDQNVAPSNELYEYIVFRISDIKDLCVCEPPSPNSRRLSLVDSAIVNASDESQQSRSSNGFPRIRYTQEFLRSVNANNSSWNENRGRSGSANNMSTSSGNLGTVGGLSNGQSNRNAGQQGNNRNGQSNNNNNSGNGNGGGFRGGRGGRGGNRGGMSGRGGSNGNNRRGAPVFPYPTQAGPQDWLTRYQKDMNLKAEFQNVNPDLSVLANIASSNELPADKVRDMMEGNWEAFLTAAELPGKTERAPTNAKAEFKDGFFDSLTAPPPTPSETMYNRRKDYETFGPANNNNNNGPSNNSGRYNNNNRQNGNQNQQQQSTQTGRWGNNNNNQGYNNQRQQQSGDGYSQGYGGRNNGGNAGNYNNNNNGRYSGNNNNNRGGRGPQRGGYVNQRGGQQRSYGGNLNSLLSGMNNGGGFTQRDLVIPAQSSNGNNWTFNQRTQAALWTPAVGLDLTQQPSVSSTTWTFACNSSSAISESGYDALSPSPVA